MCTFGWKVSKIQPQLLRPADFDAFWDGIMKELAGIPLDAKVTGPVRVMNDDDIAAYNVASACLPLDYDPTGHRAEKVEVYKVNYACVDGTRCYGWLAKPVGDGPFPAMLVLPGAAGGPRPIPAEQARHGYVALAIQVHGQDVDLEKYDQPAFVPGSGPKSLYDYRIYTTALQSMNYLASRTDVDKKKIAVVGQSQGGRLTTVVSALDRRVAAAVPCLAHMAYGPYQTWAGDCSAANPPKDGMDRDNPPIPPMNGFAPYYDTLNFAQRVTCPVFAFAGMIDSVSPVTTTYCTYSMMASTDKQVILAPGVFHEWSPEFDRRAWRWLDQKLVLK
jgi:cephalosporin-C deacetylase-like acetyl esterase